MQSSGEERVLLIDGARYILRPPEDEADLEKQVKEHSKDIFGIDSAYFDLKHKLKLESKSGVASIPDGYVLTFGDTRRWYIVEVELSSHPMHEHIFPQVTRFVDGWKNDQAKIVNALDEEIAEDKVLKEWIKARIGPEEIHRFLSNLISYAPVIVIVIDQKTAKLEEVGNLILWEKRILEFKTFAKEGMGFSVHAHLYYPLSDIPLPPPRRTIKVVLRNGAFKKYHLFRIPKDERLFFPPYKTTFKILTDIEEIETSVTSAPSGTQPGDPEAGRYVQVDLAQWLKMHPDVKVGDTLVIEAVEPLKRYRLTIP